LKNWYIWLRGNVREAGVTVPAFDWIRGRVGQRQNPDGMRSVIHYGVAFAGVGLVVNGLVAGPDGFLPFAILSAIQLIWVFGFIALMVFNVGFLETLDGRQLRHLNGANILTLGRLVLLPALGYLIAYRHFSVAGVAYLVLAFTDVVDGLWARWRGQVTKLGIVFDPLVDVAFHLWAFAALWKADLVPGWILILVLIRYALLLVGGVGLYLGKGQIRIFPTPFGKVTGILITAGCAALLFFPGGEGRPGAPAWVVQGMGVIVAATVAHVLAIGWVNLRLPLRAEPAVPQVRGRFAQSIRRKREEAVVRRRGEPKP
jgi:cardiolipin synthase